MCLSTFVHAAHLAHHPYSCTYDGHHFSDESEAAHWGLFLNNFTQVPPPQPVCAVPFLNTSTQHMLDTYGAPDKWSSSPQARSVAAFLFGLRSHQVRLPPASGRRLPQRALRALA
jgi:hypothetical protein